MSTALGEGVAGLRIGQLVGVSPSRPCRSLQVLPRGHAQPVPEHALLWLGDAVPPYSGRVPRNAGCRCQPMRSSRRPVTGEAAMAEPLAVTLHATRRAGDMLGKSVLVTGCGPIGVLVDHLGPPGGRGPDRRHRPERLHACDGEEGRRRHHVSTRRRSPDALDRLQGREGHISTCSTNVPVRKRRLTGAIAVLRPGGTILQLGLGGDMTLADDADHREGTGAEGLLPLSCGIRNGDQPDAERADRREAADLRNRGAAGCTERLRAGERSQQGDESSDRVWMR